MQAHRYSIYFELGYEEERLGKVNDLSFEITP
jgi:hypothetical protein